MSLKRIQIINTSEYWLHRNPDYPESETTRERMLEDMRWERKRFIEDMGDEFPCKANGHTYFKNEHGDWICSQCLFHSIIHREYMKHV